MAYPVRKRLMKYDRPQIPLFNPSSEVFWEKSGKTGIFEKPDVVISVS
jgi:hypothetical protein